MISHIQQSTTTQPLSRPFWRSLFMMAILTCLPIKASFADQCQLLNQQQAEVAQRYIDQAQEIWMYCLPCGDTRPVHHKIESSAISPTSDGYEIKLQGPNGPIFPVDLAYIFVPLKSKKQVYTNLAHLSQCPAVDTPLVIDENGPHSDLIH